jgi:hypothetical protein
MARGEDAGARVHWKSRDPGLRPEVEAIGLRQQALDDAADLGAWPRVGEEGVDVHPLRLQPVGRKVEASGARVFAHVAGDVGQLHRHAEVTGPGQRVGVAYFHQHAHHRTHGGGDARGIGPQVRQAGIAPFHPVPGESFQQRLGQRARHVAGLDQGGHGPVGGRVPGSPLIGEVQTVAQGQHGGGLVVAEIHLVIGHPAEGVKRQRRVAHAGGQKLRRGMEGVGSFGDRRAAVVEVALVDHSAASLVA